MCMNVYLKMHSFESVPWEILYMLFKYVNHISLSQIITGLKLSKTSGAEQRRSHSSLCTYMKVNPLSTVKSMFTNSSIII